MRTISIATAKEIARKAYWDVVKADDLPGQIRYAMFDAAYNSGPARAVKWLQRALNVVPDGVLGPKTIAAAKASNADALKCSLVGQRLSFLTDLDTWSTFGKGWSRRIASILEN